MEKIKSRNAFIKLESDEETADKNERETTDDEDNDEDKDDQFENDEPASLPYYKLYKYSGSVERILLAVGILGAWASATCGPMTVIFFGRLSKSIVEYGAQSKINECVNETIYANNTNSHEILMRTPKIEMKVISNDEFFYEMKRYAIGLIVISMFQLLCNYLMVSCMNSSAERVTFRIRKLFLRSILRQDISWFDTHQTGEYASRTTADLGKFQEGIGEKFGVFNYFAVCFLLNVINAFIHGWKLTLVMLCVVPILMTLMVVVTKVNIMYNAKEFQAYAKAGSCAEEAFTAIRTVVAFGGESKEVERYRKNLKYANHVGIKKGMAIGIGTGTVWFIIYASYALAFYYGVSLIFEDIGDPNPEYDPSNFVVVFFSVMTGALLVGQSLSYLDNFSQAKAAAASIFSVIEREPYIDSFSETGVKPDKIEGCIQFNSVVFNYPSRQEIRVLDGLDLKVESGETLAIVGKSGCGKSTLIQLIQRFYDSDEGSIKLDNCDIKLLNIGWLREHIGVVGQEPVLFGTTIAENIRYGQEGATWEDIERAAKMANAHDFIIKLPMKYETQVGERGTQLSGGQKQRVAIARALVKNPRILLLDEATSALDSESEEVILEAMDKARQGRTTIIVAHRLSTIKNSDKIAVLSEGKLAEIGTHDQLMTKEGLYYKMVNTQNGKEDIEDIMEIINENELIINQEVQLQKDPEASALPPIDFANARRTQKSTKHKSRLTSVDFETETKDDKQMASISKVLKYNEPEWIYNLLGCLASLVIAFHTPAFALIFGQFMGVLSNCNRDDAKRDSIFYSGLFVLVGLVTATATFFQIFMFSVAGYNLMQRVRRMLFASMLKQVSHKLCKEMDWFDDQQNSTGSLCTRLSLDTARMTGVAGGRIGIVVQSICTIVFCIICALILCWKLALVSMIFVPLVIFAAYLNNKIIRGQSVLEMISLDNANKIAIEAISNIRTVASLHREKTILSLYMNNLEDPHRNAIRRSHHRGLIFGVAQSIPALAYAGSLFYGGWLILHESLPYTIVFKVVELLILGTIIVGDTFGYAPNYTNALTSAKRIFDQIERKSLIDASSTDGAKLPEDSKASINFKDVQFTYHSRPDTQVLRGLNLTIPYGKTVALVGSSGCGKSTCIQIMERLYNITAGNVMIDNEDINKLNIKWLRSQIGIVSQEPILFDRTISENIAYGANHRTPTMQEIVQAAMNANAHTFISELPLGYDTRVGDKGVQLSGGQKQRIAIARALLSNPKILLLDEATSALDSESEKLVQDALVEAQKGRTCIMVAHRLSTVKDADIIAVIHKGKVVEVGTHDQLIELKGHYHKVYLMQIMGQT